MLSSAPLEPESSMDAEDHKPGKDQYLAGVPMDDPEPPFYHSETALQRVESIRPGTVILIESRDGSRTEKYYVRHASRNGSIHSIRLVRSTTALIDTAPEVVEPNYYDVLQIGPEAETETIYRVYRIMAARFHPDNPKTGDVEKFLLLKTAYEVLADPESRSEYDARRKVQDAAPLPVFELSDFVTGVEAESNRRLGVLTLLYNQRRQDPDHPSISLLHLEQRMSFPREYLSFTMWFLRSKGLVTAADNQDYVITVPGAEFVETNVGKSEALAQLLFPGHE